MLALIAYGHNPKLGDLIKCFYCGLIQNCNRQDCRSCATFFGNYHCAEFVVRRNVYLQSDAVSVMLRTSSSVEFAGFVSPKDSRTSTSA